MKSQCNTKILQKLKLCNLVKLREEDLKGTQVLETWSTKMRMPCGSVLTLVPSSTNNNSFWRSWTAKKQRVVVELVPIVGILYPTMSRKHPSPQVVGSSSPPVLTRFSLTFSSHSYAHTYISVYFWALLTLVLFERWEAVVHADIFSHPCTTAALKDVITECCLSLEKSKWRGAGPETDAAHGSSIAAASHISALPDNAGDTSSSSCLEHPEVAERRVMEAVDKKVGFLRLKRAIWSIYEECEAEKSRR